MNQPDVQAIPANNRVINVYCFKHATRSCFHINTTFSILNQLNKATYRYVLRYLKGTREIKLSFQPQEQPLTLKEFSD